MWPHTTQLNASKKQQPLLVHYSSQFIRPDKDCDSVSKLLHHCANLVESQELEQKNKINQLNECLKEEQNKEQNRNNECKRHLQELENFKGAVELARRTIEKNDAELYTLRRQVHDLAVENNTIKQKLIKMEEFGGYYMINELTKNVTFVPVANPSNLVRISPNHSKIHQLNYQQRQQALIKSFEKVNNNNEQQHTNGQLQQKQQVINLNGTPEKPPSCPPIDLANEKQSNVETRPPTPANEETQTTEANESTEEVIPQSPEVMGFDDEILEMSPTPITPAKESDVLEYKLNEKVICESKGFLYYAKIIEIRELDENFDECLVHYSGFANSENEWVPMDRIYKDIDENRKLKKELEDRVKKSKKRKSESTPNHANKKKKT
ncbi:chromatin modification-related protein eaf3 [Acrasis kona]|uniref:Chromatin modification-related protein eaf3 n=1 Tax=Acrasis kona TaxID=1008807 RepID=A0AAW2Z777_9EUKA